MRRPTADARPIGPANRPEITATGGFWAALGLFWFLDGWGLLPPFLLAAALHELAHFAALRLLDVPVRAVELRASGAVIRAELKDEPWEIPAYLAGPGMNLLLFLLCSRLWPLFSLCNLGLAVWNGIPAPGLDGGRICAVALPCLFGAFGVILCKLIYTGTLALILLLGFWATFELRLGLFPALTAGFFLLRLPKGLDKPRGGW